MQLPLVEGISAGSFTFPGSFYQHVLHWHPSPWQQLGAAAEAGAIGEQQLEAEANGEQPLSGSGCRNRAREQRTQAASSS